VPVVWACCGRHFCRRIHVAARGGVTPLGQLPFFIEYRKQGGLFVGWMAHCPCAARTRMRRTSAASLARCCRRFARAVALHKPLQRRIAQGPQAAAGSSWPASPVEYNRLPPSSRSIGWPRSCVWTCRRYGNLSGELVNDFPAEHWKHLRTTNVIQKLARDHPPPHGAFQGVSFEQERARHNLQIRRGRREELPTPRWPQPEGIEVDRAQTQAAACALPSPRSGDTSFHRSGEDGLSLAPGPEVLYLF
jgi:hypothetical protein